eukprot:3001426-Rhodomonas_salina.1
MRRANPVSVTATPSDSPGSESLPGSPGATEARYRVLGYPGRNSYVQRISEFPAGSLAVAAGGCALCKYRYRYLGTTRTLVPDLNTGYPGKSGRNA